MRRALLLAAALGLLAGPAGASHKGPVVASQLPAFTGGDCTTTAGSIVISCASLAGKPIGTAGATIPLLSTKNTWTLQQIFSNGAQVTTTTQYTGFVVSNGTNTAASLIGLSASNDGGDLNLLSGGVSVARLSALAGNYAPSWIVGATSATLSPGEQGFAKITASGTAPGAGLLKLAVVAGTNSGTCKIIAYAGTSTTPVTLLDNVGAGC